MYIILENGDNMIIFLAGVAVGTIVTGVVFIVFGKNNRNKIAVARETLLKVYDKASNEVKEEVAKAIEKIK